MDPQTIFLPAKPRVRRKRRGVAAVAAVAPVLVSASFEASDPLLTLVFDRAVTQSGPFEAPSVVVRDGDQVYNGAGGVTQVDPVTITVGMVFEDTQPGTGTSLTATAGTGIESVAGGVAWAGVTDLSLPYP